MKTNRFKPVTKAVLILSFTLLIFSCNQASYTEDLAMDKVGVSESFEAVETEEMAKALSDVTNIKTPESLKIIKSASVRYKVEDVKIATQQIKKIAAAYNAYVSDLRYENNRYQKENRFTLKVPREKFDSVMDSIGTVAEFVDYENVTTKDVTEEYIDLQARLATKLEVKKRYEDVLRNKARTVEDILETEEKLRLLQEEIESAQGRLKYLTNKVAYSTVQIDLYETVEYTEKPTRYKKTFGDKSKNAFSFGWDMIESIILLMFHVWPLWVAGIALFIFLRRRKKK